MSIEERAEAKAIVRDFLSKLLDGDLEEVGFIRRGRSLVYKRQVPGGYQSIDFKVFFRPPYARPMSHLSVDAVLHFGALMELTHAMLGEFLGLRYRADIALRQPIDCLRPGSPPLWLFDNPQSLAVNSEEIAADVTRFVVPFMLKCSSLEKYIEMQEAAYARVGDTLALDPVLLAAAVILTSGDYARANNVLERHYPAGSRGAELYRSALVYVAANVAQA